MNGDETIYYEKAIVGLALIEHSCLDRCEASLLGYQWIDDGLGQLWYVLCRMRRDGLPIGDATTLLTEVRKAKSLDAVGGVKGISDLMMKQAGVEASEGYYVGKLLESGAFRSLSWIGSHVESLIASGNMTSEEIKDWVVKELYRVRGTVDVSTRSIGELAREVVAASARVKEPGVTTGLGDLDALNGGFRAGELVILAARPSMGKSALGAQWAIRTARKESTTLFLSLEMKALDVVSRALAADTGIPFANFRSGLNLLETQQALESVEEFERIPMFICDHRDLDLSRVISIVRSETSKKKIGLVVIDYMGLIVSSDRKRPRWEAMTEISAGLKSLALSESIPILALCQLSRDTEGERPKLSHLRDSGSIEQDADLVLLLHRKDRNDIDAELIVAKNRNGATGMINLKFDPKRFSFETPMTY